MLRGLGGVESSVFNVASRRASVSFSEYSSVSDFSMPNPLSKVTPQGELWFSAGVLRNSSFSPEVAHTIALWAHIDGDLATILSKMLKADIAVGSAMYMTLTGGEAKRSVLAAAAREALPGWHYNLLMAILQVTKPSRNQRNSFAHHIWGSCTELEDELLLTHPKTIVDSNVSHRQRVKELPGGRGVIAPKLIDRSKITVYREIDFKNAVTDAQKASEIVTLFYGTLDRRSRAGTLHQLLNQPQIQQAILKMTNGSGPQAPPEPHQ